MKPLNDNLLRRCAVILLAVLAVAVYIWCFDSKIDLNSDNATYISLARNLASGQGYSDMAYGGAFVPASQFPPGYPFLLSLMVRLGLDSIVAFKNFQEIADVINRSPRYVKKALKRGFTEKEKQILINFKKQKDLFEESA